MKCFNDQVNQAKAAMKLFQLSKISLKGEYPAVPPEVMSVFAAPFGVPGGMLDGLIDQADITLDSTIIAEKVYDANFSQFPKTMLPGSVIYAYCLGYMMDKADDIYDIIGDTRVFELPTLQQGQPDGNYSINKDGLDAIMDDLGNQLEDLWPDDEDEEEQSKHAGQTNNLTKLEKELKKVMDFISNPSGPFDAEWERTLTKIKKLQEDFKQFNKKVLEAASRLNRLDFSQLSNLNDSIFLEFTSYLDQAIISCCDGMVAYYKEKMDTIYIKMEDHTATQKEEDDYWRMRLIVYDLKALKADPVPMKDYVNAYVRKKDIEALTISVNNRKMITILSRISINYQKDLLKLSTDQENMETTDQKSYKFKLSIIEGQRFCNCIRVFNKIKQIDGGIKNLFLAGVKEYIKMYFADMYKYEVNMLASCISNKTPSQNKALNLNSIDRLNTLASDIISDTKEVTEITNASESTVVNGIKSCVSNNTPLPQPVPLEYTP